MDVLRPILPDLPIHFVLWYEDVHSYTTLSPMWYEGSRLNEIGIRFMLHSTFARIIAIIMHVIPMHGHVH